MAGVQPGVVDYLSLTHECPNAIDSLVIHWLLFQGSLAHSREVKNICLGILLPLINENFILKLFNFQIPRVARLRGAHQHGCHDICCKNVCFVVFNQLNHDSVIKKRLLKGVSFEGLYELGLAAGCLVPRGVISKYLSALLNVLEEDGL